jgi:hypothetical protein
MQINHTKIHRDLEGPLHRKLRQGVGSSWVALEQELLEYATKRNLPIWKLKKILRQEILFHVDRDDRGNLVNPKGKPIPPGTLYLSKEGVLTKWLKPPAPLEEDDEEDEGYEKLPHPDHPTQEMESAGYSRWQKVPGKAQIKGRLPSVRWELREVMLPVEFYLERISGIWYETKNRLVGHGCSYYIQISQHQLSRKDLRRFQLVNDRAA